MARISGTVNAKKLLTSATPKLFPEPKAKSRPKTSSCPAMDSNPTVNHAAAGTHVHFAVELRQVRHMPNPIKAAQTILRMHSFQTSAAIEWDGPTRRNAVSRIAVPIIATARLITTRPLNFIARSIVRNSKPLTEIGFFGQSLRTGLIVSNRGQ